MLKALSVALLLVTTTALAEEVEIETYSGTVRIPATPENIAVFDLAALDSLDALGVVPNGTVRPVFLSYLEDQAQEAKVVGSVFEPDFEALNALQPELVIVGGRSAGQAADLSRLAPTIDMTVWEDPVAQGLSRLEAYGDLFDKADRAARLRDDFQTKLQATKEAAARQGKALIVMTNGPKVTAYGAAGRFGWLHRALGLPEAVADVEQSTHGEAISFEFIRDTNPDVLLVIDRLAAIGQEGENAQATLDNALVRETSAWKSGKVIYLSAAPLYVAGGGIQSMNITLDELLAAFSSHRQ